MLHREAALTLPASQGNELIKELLRLPHFPRLDLPEELRFEQVSLTPKPRLKVKAPDRHMYGQQRLRGELSFDYEGQVVPGDKAGKGIYQADKRRSDHP